MVGDQREAAIHRNTTKGLQLFIDVYMQYIMYVILKNSRIGPKAATPPAGVSVTANTSEATGVMHLFILCLNLLTRFFVFLSVLSALHETDGGGGGFTFSMYFCI